MYYLFYCDLSDYSIKLKVVLKIKLSKIGINEE
jgi:hypothetical protein